jgi:hypothetical protein
MIAQNFDGILLGPSNFCLFPAARSSAASMLDKQMATPNLFVVAVPRRIREGWWRAMMLGHVELELLRVSTFGCLPARFFGGRIEVVRKVSRVRMPNLPS